MLTTGKKELVIYYHSLLHWNYLDFTMSSKNQKKKMSTSLEFTPRSDQSPSVSSSQSSSRQVQGQLNSTNPSTGRVTQRAVIVESDSEEDRIQDSNTIIIPAVEESLFKRQWRRILLKSFKNKSRKW